MKELTDIILAYSKAV